MQVLCNGKLTEVENDMALDTFLNRYGPTRNTFAVAINNQFVSRDQYAHTRLNQGDLIEVVVAMQGG